MNAIGFMLLQSPPVISNADDVLLRKLKAIALLDSAADKAEKKRREEKDAFLREWKVEDILQREG